MKEGESNAKGHRVHDRIIAVFTTLNYTFAHMVLLSLRLAYLLLLGKGVSL